MAPHKTEIEIYYEDTDTGGVVYYANYLKYFERARTELLKSLGVDPALWVKRGVTFAVTKAEATYKGNAAYGDTIVIETEVKPLRGARLVFDYKVTHKADGRTLVTGRTDMACLNGKMRPRRTPEEILELLSKEREQT